MMIVHFGMIFFNLLMQKIKYSVHGNADVRIFMLHNNWGLVTLYGGIDLGQHWLR